MLICLKILCRNKIRCEWIVPEMSQKDIYYWKMLHITSIFTKLSISYLRLNCDTLNIPILSCGQVSMYRHFVFLQQTLLSHHLVPCLWIQYLFAVINYDFFSYCLELTHRLYSHDVFSILCIFNKVPVSDHRHFMDLLYL